MTLLIAFTIFHTLISFTGILAGFIVIANMLRGRHAPGWAAIFLTATEITSLTGFLFPVQKLMPSHIVGFISVILLSLAIYALYRRKLSGGWRKTYVVSSIAGQYLDFFVLVAQSFAKVPALHALAPTQQEPPFAIVQLIVMLGFVVTGILAVKSFRKDEPILLRHPMLMQGRGHS